jgi:hypothetical protein
MAAYLFVLKLIHPHVDMLYHHGPWFVVASVLIVAGVQLLAMGLLGELQVRHHFAGQHPAAYTVDRIVRLASADEQSLLPDRRDGNF